MVQYHSCQSMSSAVWSAWLKDWAPKG